MVRLHGGSVGMMGWSLDKLKGLAMRLPGLARIQQKQQELDRRAAALSESEADILRKTLRFRSLVPEALNRGRDSIDRTPWNHPFLHEGSIRRFEEFSRSVWAFAMDYHSAHPSTVRCAFAVNMAQNMHNWARLAQQHGADVALFTNEMDHSALNTPEWEEFDGEFVDPANKAGFLSAHPDIKLEIPCVRVPFEGSDFYAAYQRFCQGDRVPLLRFMSSRRSVRYESLLAYEGFYPYVRLARALSEHDVIFIASTPFPAYASGKPYCAVSVGGDLIFDCGRADDLGIAMHLGFSFARFLIVCNPHTLGHARRLGLTNGVYLPYPVDTDRYCPGVGEARQAWEARYGKGVFVLTTARVDAHWKGYGEELFTTLVRLARQQESLRFIFLAWGENLPRLRMSIDAAGLGQRMVVLPPVGKKRLIDYYRSCDLVLDQFVSGYFAATSLEAASVGKPVIMKLRSEHYEPLYPNLPPVLNADSPAEIAQHLVRCAAHQEERTALGSDLRHWLVRTHGHERTVPLMLALLRLTADGIALPPEVMNPLAEPESEEERQYHAACMMATA
jgi:glycosyltransferase involved in cell wall biosynthesis